MRCQTLAIRLVLVLMGALTLTTVAVAAEPKQTVIYTFEDQSDGEVPSGLVADAAGNLYGTAAGGADGGLGVV